VGSLRALAVGGASSVTYFETTGARGLMDDEGVFPVYLALRGALEFGGNILETRSSDPSRAHVLALESGGSVRAIVVNFTAETIAVDLEWPQARADVRVLDESNVLGAMRAPDQHRPRYTYKNTVLDGALEITLPPFALATIDQI
jgi:hypothetical protein